MEDVIIFSKKRLNEGVYDILDTPDDDAAANRKSNLIVDKGNILRFLERFKGIKFDVKIEDDMVKVDPLSITEGEEPELRVDDSMIVEDRVVLPVYLPQDLLKRVIDLNGGKLIVSKNVTAVD